MEITRQSENEVFLMNYLHALNWLSYDKNKQKVIENLQRSS